MDNRISSLQNMLSHIAEDMEKLAEEIQMYSDSRDIEKSFDNISRLVNQNRRAILRAKQYTAEISYLSKS